MKFPSRSASRPAAVAVSFVLLGLGILGLAPGCSSDPVAAACDSTKCAPNNQCVNDGKETKCRFVCEAQTCPFNYHCEANPTPGQKSFCVQDAKVFTKVEKGQWGAPCATSKGIDPNDDCDFNQFFACHAQSPTDANAFCTIFDCATDADCKGGWYCAKVNTTPNAATVTRKYGETRNVCMPRTHCAPCKTDLDCPAGPIKHHCIEGSDKQKFCASICDNNGSCPKDAQCVDKPENPAAVCVPNAGTCKGDGGFCQPCRNDSDCQSGVCATSQYSREKFCTAKSGKECKVVSGRLESDCPQVGGANWKATGCITTVNDEMAPKDHCYAFVIASIDRSSNQPDYLPGCWTTNDMTKR